MRTSVHKELKTEIKNYINHADDRMLKLIHAIIEADQDWWDEISIEEKQSVEKGAAQLKEGKGIPHREVQKKFNQWLTK